jgi:hypothetical protein
VGSWERDLTPPIQVDAGQLVLRALESVARKPTGENKAAGCFLILITAAALISHFVP